MQSASPTVHTCPTAAGEQLSGVVNIGLICFGGAMALTHLSVAGHWPFSASLLGALLLNCASAQILIGITVWRRQQPFPALLLITFGLFWFSRLAFDVLPHAGFGTALSAPAACGNLLLWGLFALILSNADECPRLLRLALYGIGATLLLQAAGTLFLSGLLLPLSGYVGLATALLLGVSTLPRLRTHTKTNS